MQGGQGRGRPVYSGRGGAGRGGGGLAAAAAMGYPAGFPGFFYGSWGSNYPMHGFYPVQPPMRAPHPRAARPFAPLGVQGAGLLKRPSAPSQGSSMNGRGHHRGQSGRGWGGRNRKNITKEALDADLDEWRLKDKKFGGQSLDADLDDYWKKKSDDPDEQEPEADVKDLESKWEEGPSEASREAPATARVSATGSSSVSHSEESLERTRTGDISPYRVSPAKSSGNV